MYASMTQDLHSLTDTALAAPASASALYHEAFEIYGATCFWSTKEMQMPSVADAIDTASRLKREGDMASRRLAEKIEGAIRAAL